MIDQAYDEFVLCCASVGLGLCIRSQNTIWTSEVEGPFGDSGILFGRPNMRSLKARQVAKDKERPHHRVLVTYSAYESIGHTLHMGFCFFYHGSLTDLSVCVADKTRPQSYVHE